MLNKGKSQKIIFCSKDISSLPTERLESKIISTTNIDQIHPRIFPNNKIPLKIAIMRKIKEFQQFDLNLLLKQVDWKFRKGALQLTNFNYQIDTIMEQCTKQRLQKNQIKGKAYDDSSKTFKEFTVNKIQKFHSQYILSGYFISKPTQIIQIDKFYVCLSFQNPQKFAKTILKAVQRREQFLNRAKYYFYVDNIDIQEAPEITKKVINSITKFIGIDFMSRQQYLQLNKHYKRVMNQLLFNRILTQDEGLVIERITVPEKRKRKYYKPKNRVITLMKDNKLFKLTLKSLQNKKEEFQSKFLYAKEQIVLLMYTIRQKLLGIYDYPIFDLKEQLSVIDKFAADNFLMTGYFMLFIQEKIINKIGQLIRKALINDAEGWFKIYQTDRNTYLTSKLRRLFISIEQNIKSNIKKHIHAEIQRCIQAFSKRLPKSISFQSFSQYELFYKDQYQVEYCPFISLNVVIGNNTFEMTMKKEKISQNLKKNIESMLRKISRLNSPQGKALVELYSMFKDEYGITIQIPFSQSGQSQQNINVNRLQYAWIQKQICTLNSLIDRSIDTLQILQKQFTIESTRLNLKQILSDKIEPFLKVQDIVDHIRAYRDMHSKIESFFPGNGIAFGLFFIDYKSAKNQLAQFIQKRISLYQIQLVKEYKQKSQNLQAQLNRLYDQIKQKPMNIYELVKQRENILMLQQIIEQFRQDQEINLYNLCEENLCLLNRNDSHRRWTNAQKIKELFVLKEKKFKEYEYIRQEISQETQIQQSELDEMLKLFQMTLNSVKQNHWRASAQYNYTRLEYLKTQYLNAKNQIINIQYKEIHLKLEPHDFQLFDTLQESFLILFSLWQTINKWQIQKDIWHNHALKSFSIEKIQVVLGDMLNNIKKVQKNIKVNYSNELFLLINEVKKEIIVFEESHLRLLKILKKEGFSSKHLLKIGIYLQEQISQITLQKAIDEGFLLKIQEINSVSNDAWNEFYLEQTLNRVFNNLITLKYEIIYYLDKKQNEIPLINNYSTINVAIEEIIMELESIQFNPMKSLYEVRINDLFEKSVYISKSIEACQIFQTKFIELHPIFDSTDVVKQLPVQNKLFTKIMKSWIEMLKYMKKIVSVYDSCNGQNVCQKMTSMIKKLEIVKVGLSNYLQKKRQGFSRFYLLTDQQLYEIFASTNDMNILSKHISKLFHSINNLIFDNEKIIAIEGKDNILKLKTNIYYRHQNLEDWLINLQKSIRETIKFYIQKIIRTRNKWSEMLNFQCSQVLLLCYEIFKTSDIEKLQDFKKLQQKQKKLIQKLIQIKKTTQLSPAQIVNLGSLLVLSLYFSEKFNSFVLNDVNDLNCFQIKKILKVYYNEDDDDIKLKLFQAQIFYGYEYLGLIKRLVLTNLTQRMQLIFISSIKYSLGSSAIGPAGTGKSQTSKDIARICGKTCLIYNASESLSIDILIRILKGMIVTGFWVCIDEFNRLSMQVLSLISDQLAIIFKYKAMQQKLSIDYDRQLIDFQPDFHLCTTYNPTYVGRQTIPKNVLKYFRTIALVNCDKKVICKLLFYSKGFKEADDLSQRLNRLFQKCQQLWNDQKLYDFGLRTLISVIELSGMIYKGDLNGQIQILQAIKILVVPRLSDNHKKIMTQLNFQYFKLRTKIEGTAGKKNNDEVQKLDHILHVRLGIILLGDILSNKSTIMAQFQKKNKENNVKNRIQFIHINSLTVDQIYGETNVTTRIFKDGYLTKKIREFILTESKAERLIIYIKGVIYPEWIQNLNSVLDNTRSLSLPSGEILSIPNSVKFIINCSNLDFASPATISRSCIVCYKNKTLQQILICPNQTLKRGIVDVFEKIMKELKVKIIYKLDQRLIIHWINKFHTKTTFEVSLESFLSFFAFILDGMLNQDDKEIAKNLLHRHVQFREESIFDHYWDGLAWMKVNKAPLTNHFQYDSMKSLDINHLIIPNIKYKKIEYYMRIFLAKNNRDREDMLLLIGRQNSGKSSNIEYLAEHFNTKLYNYSKINMTRNMQNEQLHFMIESQLHKKSIRRKGMINGKEMVIFIDDLHLPDMNKYKLKDIICILTLLLEKKGCYNYNLLEFQALEDLHLIGNYNVKHNDIALTKEFMKTLLPIFVSPFVREEIKEIFKQIVTSILLTSQTLQNIYQSYCFTLIECLQEIESKPERLPNILHFSFNHYRKILNNIMSWELNQHTSTQNIKNLFVFEAQRIILSRFSSQSAIQQIKDIFNKHFQLGPSTREILIYSFEKTVNGTTINRNKCVHVDIFEDLMRQIEYICDQYVLYAQSANNSLVVFSQLCVLLCRICRGLVLKKGNISLIGLPRCGKKIIAELCNYLIRGKIYRTNTKYDNKIWSQLIKNSTKQSFVNKCQAIILLQQSQFKDNSIKEQLNTLLKTSFLPNVYSQADYQELVYLFQSELIKNRLPVNKQCAIKLFIDYLQKNLHIFLLFNPQAKAFKEDMLAYPAISKYTQLYWIIQWPRQALVMIATQTIIQTEIEMFINILPDLHQISKEQTAKLTTVPHWEGLYLDLISIFNKIYEQNKRNLKLKQQTLQKSFLIIKQTQIKLQATRDQIKRLQPAILLLQKQTIKTIKSINLQKSNVESINEQLSKKQTEINKVITEANIVKNKLSISNARVQEQLKKAWENVSLVKQSHISEIKVLLNPSDFIKMVVTAIVIIINDGQFEIIRNRTEDGLGSQQNYFATGQRYIFSKDSKQITKMLTEYNKQKLNKQKIALLQDKCLNHPRWTLSEAKSANKAIYYFFIWADAVVKYFKLFQQTIPLRQELSQITRLVDEKTKEIHIIKKELDIYEQKIKQLTAINKEKNEKLIELTNQIKLFQKMLNRGYDILKEIQSEKLKWEQYDKNIVNMQEYNLGNSLMCSALIIYTSMHTMENRNMIMKKFKQEMQKYEIKSNENNKFWLMEAQEEIILKELGIYENDYVLNNLKIIQKTEKINFIIDPEEEGMKYIRNKYKTQSTMFIQKINYSHNMFRKTIQKCILEGLVIFIEIDGMSLPYLIQFLINPKFRSNEANGNIEMLFDIKYLNYNNKFKFYLFTSNQSQKYSIELISKVTTTNFSISRAQLEQNLIDIIIATNFPQEKEELQDINKENIKNNIELKLIQSKILNIFANMTNCEDILKTEDILQILTSSNRLYVQIQKKIEDSNEKRVQLKKKREHFRLKATKTSKLYFQIRKMSYLSNFYRYSFDWFINLFKENINNFSDVLSEQLAKGLPLQKKIIAALIIAESQFPQVPFKNLFNQSSENREEIHQLYNFKVSKERLGKIIKKIQNSKIQNLSSLVLNSPQKFQDIFNTDIEQILSAIPNELSHIQFFQKILMISCFRPDCVIKLLKDWFDINLGSSYNTQIIKIMQNTSCKTPLLVLQNTQSMTQASEQIYKLSQLYYKESRSICYIDTKSCNIQKIRIMLESGHTNDQWVILQGLGQNYQELIQMVITFVEQLDVKKNEYFRFWIVIKDFQLKYSTEKFIKMCGKVIFEEQIQIHKKISTTFMTEMNKLLSHGMNYDTNKKKYILHELCIFHYMLEEKYKYKQKLWNEPMRFYQSDLLLNSQYLYFTNSDELKRLYPTIVTQIVYGARLTSQEDIETIQLHIKETIKNTLLQRNLFWQTVWAEDTFPKSIQEYQFFTKNIIAKSSSHFKSLYEQYGITQYLKTHLKQKQYKEISNFYNRMLKNENKKTLMLIFNERVNNIWNLIKANQRHSYLLIDRYSSFYCYFTDESLYYSNLMASVENQLQMYSSKQDFNDQEWSICLDIANNVIPKSWNIKSILTLQAWLNNLVQGQKFIKDVLEEEVKAIEARQYWKSVVFPLQLTYNFNNLAYNINKMNNSKGSESCLAWYAQNDQRGDIGFGIKVNRWYIWNAIFEKQIKPLQKGMIEEHYYNVLPLGTLTIISQQQRKLLKNYQEITLYDYTFEYGESPVEISKILMPTFKNKDIQWIKRMKVHLTLTI